MHDARKSVRIPPPVYAPRSSSGVRARPRPDGRYRVAVTPPGWYARTLSRRARRIVRRTLEWIACVAVALALVVAAVVVRGTDEGAEVSPNSRRAP